MIRPSALALALFALPASACEFHMGFPGMGGMGGFGHLIAERLVDPAPAPPPTRAEALAAVRAHLLARTPALKADASAAGPAAGPAAAASAPRH